MNQTREKWGSLTFEWYEENMVFRVLIFIVLFRTNVKKGLLDENDLQMVIMAVFSKVPFRKVFHHSYVKNSFSTITMHLDSSSLKDSLQLKTVRAWIKIMI